MRFDWRIVFALTHDLVACGAAWLISFWLRFNLDIPEPYVVIAVESLIWVVPLYGALFLGFGLYRGLWRFASLPDLKRIIAAVAVGAIAVPTALFMLQIDVPVPRSVLITSPVFLAMIMGGSRLAYRAWKEHSLDSMITEKREPVFVLGAAEAAVNLIRELARSPQWKVVGVFDDDITKHGRQLHGVNVLGGLGDLPHWKQKLGIQHAIIAMPEATHSARRHAVELCRNAGLDVLAPLYAAETEVGKEFDAIRARDGLKAALAWRKKQFED